MTLDQFLDKAIESVISGVVGATLVGIGFAWKKYGPRAWAAFWALFRRHFALIPIVVLAILWGVPVVRLVRMIADPSPASKDLVAYSFFMALTIPALAKLWIEKLGDYLVFIRYGTSIKVMNQTDAELEALGADLKKLNESLNQPSLSDAARSEILFEARQRIERLNEIKAITERTGQKLKRDVELVKRIWNFAE